MSTPLADFIEKEKDPTRAETGYSFRLDIQWNDFYPLLRTGWSADANFLRLMASDLASKGAEYIELVKSYQDGSAGGMESEVLHGRTR